MALNDEITLVPLPSDQATDLLMPAELETLVGARHLDTLLEVLSPSNRAMMFAEAVGITPLEPLFPSQDLSPHAILVLFGLSAGEDGVAAKSLQYRDRIGEQFIPIADDGLGNLFVLDKSDGKVLFWFHESENGEDSPTAFAVVASDLDAFFTNIETLTPTTDLGLESGVKRVTLNF